MAHDIVLFRAVLKLTGIDDFFGPKMTLLVPDESYLEHADSCYQSTFLCRPEPTWFDKHVVRELRTTFRSPWAWVALCWFLVTASLGVCLLVRVVSKKHHRPTGGVTSGFPLLKHRK